jgi:hypothetical protein
VKKQRHLQALSRNLPQGGTLPTGDLNLLEHWFVYRNAIQFFRPGFPQEMIRGEMAYEEQDKQLGFRFEGDSSVFNGVVGCNTWSNGSGWFNGGRGSGACGFPLSWHHHGHQR